MAGKAKPRKKNTVAVAPLKASNVAETLHTAIAFSTDNVQAAVMSGAILSRGVQALNHAAMGVMRITWQDDLSASKALSNCKSPKDAVELEFDLLCTNGSRLVAKSCMLAVMAMQVGEDSVVPLVNRFRVAYDSALAVA